MINTAHDNWFGSGSLPYGWAGELTYPNKIGFNEHYQLYGEMIDWINENISNPRSNALWAKLGDCIYVQFRKKKDMTWFTLRFGA